MILTTWRNETEGLFSLVASRADRQDLEAVKSEKILYKDTGFQQAVEQALKDVGTESRHESRRQKRVAAAKEALNNGIPNDPFSIIAEYID